jgi:hypothetical protein
MEKLDNLVAEHIADRLLQPERLEKILVSRMAEGVTAGTMRISGRFCGISAIARFCYPHLYPHLWRGLHGTTVASHGRDNPVGTATPSAAEKLDAWREGKGVNRSTAIRRFVEQALRRGKQRPG